MGIEIRLMGTEAVEELERVPIRFRVDSVLLVEEVDRGLGGLRLREEPLDEPYVKDYDILDPPERWAEAYDTGNWAFFVAYDAHRPVGAAIVVPNAAEFATLDRRTSVAVLFDIRVHPDRRREGIGGMLLERAADWAREQGCVQLQIETQNINARACRFYAACGCRLGAIARHAYGEPELAEEVMLLWYLDL